MKAKSDNTKNVAQLKRGDSGQVSHFLNPKIASKLLAMGVLPGSAIQMIRNAPFGGGCYVKVDNLSVALRKDEAGTIVLK